MPRNGSKVSENKLPAANKPVAIRRPNKQKRSEEDQRFLLTIAEKIRTARNAEALLSEIAEMLGVYLCLHRCLFNEIDLARDLETVHLDYSRTGESVAGKHRISAYSTVSSNAMRSGVTVVNNDSKTDPRTAPLYKKVYGPSKERSYITVPMLREGVWVASLWCSDDAPREWTTAEVSLVESIAERTWAAVERVRSEEALREQTEQALAAQAKFQAVFDQSGIFAGIMDLDGRVREVNELAVEACGYKREDILGKLFWRTPWWRGSRNSQARIKEAFRQAAAGNVFRETLSYWIADGSKRIVDFAMHPIRDETGKVTFLHPTGVDITERIEIQEEIRQVSRMTAENPFPVMRIKRDGTVIYSNPASEPLLESWRHLFKGLPPELRTSIAKAMSTGSRQVLEFRFDDRTFSSTVVPVIDSGYVNLYATDITERKTAEDALRESEERFSKAFNASPLVLTISSLVTGKLVEVNQTFVKTTGYSREEAVGKTTLELGLWARPADREAEMETVRRKGQLSGTEYAFRVRGNKEIIGLLAAERIDIGGEACTLTVIQDITDRKIAEEQRSILLEREAEARREAEILNELSRTLAAELHLEKVVQSATDAATALVRAQFGAFFYNLVDDEGESYQLYALSGARRSAFERFGMPRNTPIFEPTFRGEGVVRLGDVTKHPLYGKMPPHYGMPKGHLAVRSYLAAPVVSRSGEVLGAIFLGHPKPDVFKERDERMIVGLASIAAVAMDNARLYGDAQRDIEHRRAVEAALRKSEEQLRVVTDAMPALISYVDRDERYVFANQTYREWFGVEPASIVGKKTKSVFGAKAYSTIRPWVMAALAGKESRFETEVEYKSGGKRYVHVAYVPDFDAAGSVRGYFGFTVDMTDLKRSQELLRSTEEKTTMMMDICRDYAILSTDPAGIIDSWNTGAEQIFGYSESEAIGMNSARLFTPEDVERKVPEKEMRTAKRLGRASDERWHIRKDESRFYASGVMMPLYVGKHLTGYAKIASDLTEKQRHAEELQRAHDELELRVADRTKELAESNTALIREAEARIAGEQQRIYLLRRLVTSQEFERRRIARDIHDQLGQRLTGLRLKLASLRSIVGDSDEVATRVSRIQEISERLDAEVSFLAWELRPTALDDLGLIEALRTFVKEWSRHYEISADFHSLRAADIRLDPDVETHLYRITQEALNNTMKHAGAENISVMLERRRDELILIIEDDGKGFDPAAIAAPRKSGRGLGLMGMKERAALVGGNLEIESAPGGGTTIFVRVPTTAAA